MKKLIVVGSSIQTNNHYAFSHGKVRSAFTNEERFRQTVYTINCLRNIFPDDQIVILDGSFDDFDFYKQHFGLYNADYIPFARQFPEEHRLLSTHHSVAYCEGMLLKTFFREYKSYIKNYDYVIKTTGRYVYSNIDTEIFNENNTDKMFFKSPFKFEWMDSWNYDMIDMRQQHGDNFLYQYSTVLYAFGTQYLNIFIDLLETMNHVINTPLHWNFDMETAAYYFTRPYANNILHLDWKITGWEGAHAKFMHY